MRIVIIALLGACSRDAAPVREPTAPSMNDRVLGLIATYPERSHGGYVWPSRDGAMGTTRDLELAGQVIARGGEGNHCVGMTFEVFWRALEGCEGGITRVFDPAAAHAFRKQWYVPVAGGLGAIEALASSQLGAPVTHRDARPGDFVQAWNSDGTFGHSMVFLGWDYERNMIRYWSSQPWTDGIGPSESVIGDDGFDPARIHIARATCPRG